MHKLRKIKTRILGWSLTKKIIYGVLVLLLVFLGYQILKPKNNAANITTDTAKVLDLKRTVLATGQVTSTTNLNLSFTKSGVVKSLRVKVGDKVKEGQILATLDQGNELASLTSAKAGVAAAQARYKRIMDGASSEEVKLSELALENAKRDYDRLKAQHDTLVQNAYKAVLNSTPEARPVSGYQDFTPPTISGNYNKSVEGEITISTYQSVVGHSFRVGGIASGEGQVNSTVPQPIGDTGLYISFPGVEINIVNQWVIEIPNKKASNYITNLNAHQAAIKARDSALGNAQALIDQREAELAIKKSAARPADVDLAQADILSAQGTLQAATANYEHTILRAPISGTITKVDIKLGELAQAQKEVVTLEDVGSLYLEANINEANVELIKVDAPVDLTFDAFGTENTFKGRIVRVDPSSTLVSGVVNYKVTAAIDDVPNLRPGMTANMTILVGEKPQVTTVPSRAVITSKDGKKVVRLIINAKTKEYEEVTVSTGMEGDGGLVEITSGISANDEVVTLIKK